MEEINPFTGKPETRDLKYYVAEPKPATREQLSQGFGCLVPESFVRLVNRALDEKNYELRRVNGYYSDLGFCFDGRLTRSLIPDAKVTEQSDPAMPPEFFPLGDMYNSIVMYGYVVLAPEVPFEDYPVATFDGADDCIIVRGRDTEDAFLEMACFLLRDAIRDAVSEQLNELSPMPPCPKGVDRFDWSKKHGAERGKILETIVPDADRVVPQSGIKTICKRTLAEFGRRMKWKEFVRRAHESLRSRNVETSACNVVTPPPGYRHVPTCNNVGVLAPEASFDAGALPEFTLKDRRIWQRCLTAAEEALSRGFPGTSLYYLQSGWNLGGESQKTFVDTMCRAYRELNRELIAAKTMRNFEYFAKHRS